jgi:hypothetical protein
MAERVVSPAVFTNEVDQSFLAQGISQIGGAIVGPFDRGPAFSPTVVRSQAQLEDLFGAPDGKYYQPWVAREYLKHQGVVTIVRVGSLGGYVQDSPALIKATAQIDSGTYEAGDEFVIGILANTFRNTDSDVKYDGFPGAVITDGLIGVDKSTATISIDDSDSTEMISNEFSIDPSSPDSIHNIFGRAAQKNSKSAYLYSYFEDTAREVYEAAAGGLEFQLSVEASSTGADSPMNFEFEEISEATTPMIQSQLISGARYDLFKVVTRNMGTLANTEIKIGLYNIKTPGSLQGTDYGTFSLIVRRFGDNDKNQEVLENYDNLTLDPTSPQYLPRVIGDRRVEVNSAGKIIEHGDYGNQSNWIRIQMPNDAYAPANAMPYGYGPYMSPLAGINVPEPAWSYASHYKKNSGRYFNGTVFNEESPDGLLKVPQSSRNTLELFKPIPPRAGTAGNGFFLDEAGTYTSLDPIPGLEESDYVAHSTPGIDSHMGDSSDYDNVRKRRFLVGFQGGFDGKSPTHPIRLGADITNTNVQGLNCSDPASEGTQGYIKAFAALSNQDEFDINLLVTPGLSLDLHRNVINRGVDLCETREDTFYILDAVGAAKNPGGVSSAVTEVSTLDSNYAATYYPWVKVIDPATNRIMPFPPSAVMPAVFAANDKVSAEWFAPAGLNRGGIEKAVGVMDRLNFAERDELYEGKVNPIAAFPGQGIVAFGQKTLQRRSSALDRINVRRLMIALKKFIASTARFLIFEQNVTATRNRFLGIVNPYLESVQQRNGLYAYRVVMDESNNTPDLIDRNILYGQVFLQPAKAIEFVILDFNLTPTGASFEG